MILAGTIKKDKKLNFITDYHGFYTKFRNRFQKGFRTLFNEIESLLSKSEAKTFIETGVLPIDLRKKIELKVRAFCESTLDELTATAGQRALESLKKQVPAFKITEDMLELFKNRQSESFIQMVSDVQLKALREVSELFYRTNRFDDLNTNDLTEIVSFGSGLNGMYLRSSLNFYAGQIEGGSSRRQALARTKAFMNKRYNMRAKTYALDATLNAYREAEFFAVGEGLSQGVFHGVVKKWSTSEDNRVCPICKVLKTQTVEYDEDFMYEGQAFSGIGGAHPACRCGIIYIDKELYESGALD